MPPTPADFARATARTFEMASCSPAIADDVRGLVIDGPAVIPLDDPPVLPVSGTYRVGAPFFNRFTSMQSEIVIVAVDAATHAPRSTNLLRPGFRPVPAAFDESEEGWEEAVIAGWFNVDLFAWIPDLPRRPGRFHVFAVLGDLTSNALTLELRAR